MAQPGRRGNLDGGYGKSRVVSHEHDYPRCDRDLAVVGRNFVGAKVAVIVDSAFVMDCLLGQYGAVGTNEAIVNHAQHHQPVHCCLLKFASPSALCSHASILLLVPAVLSPHSPCSRIGCVSTGRERSSIV